MTDQPAVIAAVSFLLGAFASAVVGAWVTRAMARLRRVNFVRQACGFFAEATLEDGSKVRSLVVDPTQIAPQSRAYTLLIHGTLINETEIQQFFPTISLEFVKPSGERSLYMNPRLIVNDSEIHVLALEPRSATPITVAALLPASGLKGLYSQALPILSLRPAKGKELRFRASATSFLGEPMAYWSRRSKLPVAAVEEPLAEHGRADA